MELSSASISSRPERERVIAAGRVVLAAASLFAVWLDPAEPAHYAQTVYSLHLGYVLYATFLAALMWTDATWRLPVSARLPMLTHIGDIIIVSVLQYLTLGPSSPFFLYFQFSLFCGALRWGWKGTLWTAAATFIMYLLMAASMIHSLGPREFEMDRFIIRSVYLLVSAGILVYLGRYESRLRGEIERLARWPVSAGIDTERAIEQVMEHAAAIVGSNRAVAIWDAGEEPTVRVACWAASGASTSTHPPDTFYPLVTASLESATILCAGQVDGGATLLEAGGDGRISSVEGRLNVNILPLVEGVGLASAAFKTERISGRVFFVDFAQPPAEIVPLTEVVARQIGASLDQLFVADQMKEIAAGDERIRVARDLHDGVLQSLTGIRLEIRAVAAALDAEPGGRDRLFAIERALAIEQRELRFFIGGLGPGGPRDDGTLEGRLHAIRERIALEWKLPVTIRYTAHQALPERVERAVPLMVHEAVVNAVKHAQPSRVSVNVHGGPDELRIIVSDDGRGFPFRGVYEHATLTSTNVGPKSLLDRVSALGGRMSIESTDAGSRVEMVLAL